MSCRLRPRRVAREVIGHEELFIDLHDHLPPEMIYERELLICPAIAWSSRSQVARTGTSVQDPNSEVLRLRSGLRQRARTSLTPPQKSDPSSAAALRISPRGSLRLRFSRLEDGASSNPPSPP
jgi:hypothetical protein